MNVKSEPAEEEIAEEYILGLDYEETENEGSERTILPQKDVREICNPPTNNYLFQTELELDPAQIEYLLPVSFDADPLLLPVETYEEENSGAECSQPFVVVDFKTEKYDKKPPIPYPVLIGLALKNSARGHLHVQEIFRFFSDQFPYFKISNQHSWKGAVNCALNGTNKFFRKIHNVLKYEWTFNEVNYDQLESDILYYFKRYPVAIRTAMRTPENLERIVMGKLKIYGNGHNGTCFGYVVDRVINNIAVNMNTHTHDHTYCKKNTEKMFQIKRK